MLRRKSYADYDIYLKKGFLHELWSRLTKDKWLLNWSSIHRERWSKTDREMKLHCWELYQKGFKVEYYKNGRPWKKETN